MQTLDLFDDNFNDKAWKDEWQDMPEFSQENLQAHQQIIVNFESEEDVKDFEKLIDQRLLSTTKSIWFPKQNREKPSSFIYTSEEKLNPKYPIYIISKGRSESRLTSKALEQMQVPYRIVVEPAEYDQYSAVIDPKKILKLPENFSELNQGGIPVRNWVWEHSISEGHKRHWILDDNIDGFIRLNRNRKIKVDSGITFKAIEDFVDRYENIGMAGMNYRYFAPERAVIPAYTINTRIYSCILIKNDLPHRWRGRYNEDTDLSLRMLKDGLCTVLFNAFLCNKIGTLKMKGGNTDTIYNTGDERKEFAQSLADQHPDIVKVVRRYDRWHHEVNYSGFKKNKLIKKQDLEIKKGMNNYGMILKKVSVDN